MFYNWEDSKYEGSLIRLRDWQVGGWTKMKKRWTVGKKSILVWFNRNVAVGQLYSLERNFFFLPLFPGLRNPASDIQAYSAVLQIK